MSAPLQPRGPGRLRHAPRQVLILLLRAYQWVVSPALHAVCGPGAGCRYSPGCSEYARQAIEAHGARHGSWLAARRLCRCHPWGGGVPDPVPVQLNLPISNFKSVRHGS